MEMTKMNDEKKYRVGSFVVAFIIAAITFIPFIIMDNGFFVYYGDYNAQQIPFYETCVKAVQSGELGWNWNTDLGVNFIASYAGILASPFFWITALFPPECAKYFLAPFLIVKIGLCSLFAYMYIRRFVNRPQSAFIGGILYAFSGYSLYNIVFTGFHEVILTFPLLLIALEEAVVNKRRGVFALAVAMCASLNYFMFYGECVFLVIYFLVRLAASSEFRINLKDFFCLAFESITGVMLSCITLLPSVMHVAGGDKAANILNGGNFMTYEVSQYYLNILKGMLFVTDIAGDNAFFPHINHNWNSCAIFLPLFAMVGVIAFFFSKKKHWAKPLLAICLLMAFVPGFNAAFTMFNSMYYARWVYMPMLICCLVTVYALENFDISAWKKGFAGDGLVVGLMFVLLVFHPVDRSYKVMNEYGDISWVKAIFPRFMTDLVADDIYVFTFATAVILLALYLIVRFRDKLGTRRFINILSCGTIICSMVLSIGCVLYGRSNKDFREEYGDIYATEVNIDDDSTYRVEIVARIHDVNLNMIWDLYSAKSFNSIVPPATSEIYSFVQLPMSEVRSPSEEYTALRSLLGVKYLVYDEELVGAPEGMTNEEVIEAVFQGFKVIDKNNGYYIVENTYAVPMGYAYDQYILNEDTENKVKKIMLSSTSMIDRILVECVALSHEQVQKYSDILTQIPYENIDTDSWTDERLEAAAAARRAAGVEDFSFGNSSFHARTAYESDELVVFSVPYDEGWSAYIDGEPVETDKVNGGFIAVRVPAGEHNIDFTYTVPWLREGIILTVTGALLVAGWFVLWYVILKKGVRPRCAEVTAHAEYIANASSIDTHGEE